MISNKMKKLKKYKLEVVDNVEGIYQDFIFLDIYSNNIPKVRGYKEDYVSYTEIVFDNNKIVLPNEFIGFMEVKK